MRKRPGIRRVIKWAAVVLLVLTIAGWVLTRSSGVTAVVSGWVAVYFGEGTVAVYSVRSVVPSQVIYGPQFSRAHGAPAQAFSWTRTPSRWQVMVPTWFMALATSLVLLGAWHLDTRSRRRPKVGLCSRCSYDREGIAPDAACPECGAPAGGISKSA